MCGYMVFPCAGYAMRRFESVGKPVIAGAHIVIAYCVLALLLQK